MRSARMLLATAAATAALAFTTPGAAFAVTASGDGGHGDSSYSKEHDKGSGKEHDKDYSTEHDSGHSHDAPRGGMHTGGGALAMVNGDWGGQGQGQGDSRFDPDTYRDKGDGGWSGDHDKPHGGMHTGGGGLATTSGVTAGGLAVLGLAGAGAFALRRRKGAQPA